MTILPKYYCPTCKKFKNGFQVIYGQYMMKTCFVKTWGHICKWCHEPVKNTKDAVEEVLGLHAESIW